MSAGDSNTTTKIDWRERRGAATREQILDAAVRAIVRHGYAALTTTMIADTANVSRGAMLHHFPSKDVIIRETIKYLFEKRMGAFRKMVGEIPAKDDRIRHSIEIFWKQVNHPYFIAFFELTVAARTDKSLLEMLAPCQKALEERGLELAQALFPEVDRDRLALGLALSQAVMESLAFQRIRRQPTEADKRLIAYLEEQIRSLYGLDS
ncbi:MAG TPA: TetR/AcrR family transcriptional regulator [Sphingomonadales bacterium]